jgi:hypothetical protein
MATDKQIAANRLNAQNSTGPRTPEGKAISARNARTHGLTSTELLTDFEEPDKDDLVNLAAALKQQYDPQSEMEFILVEQMISAAWRLRRIRRIETRQYLHSGADLGETREHTGDRYDDETQVFRTDCKGPRLFDTLSRHESRLERSLYRALKELERIQSPRPPDASPTPSTTSEELGSICKIDSGIIPEAAKCDALATDSTRMDTDKSVLAYPCDIRVASAAKVSESCDRRSLSLIPPHTSPAPSRRIGFDL